MFRLLNKTTSRTRKLQIGAFVLATSIGSTLNSTIWNESVNVDTPPLIAASELANHNKKGDLWVSIHGHVYDVSDFLEMHPGGEAKLLQYAGKDATRGFRVQHPEGYLEKFLDKEWYKGELIKENKKSKSKSKSSNISNNIEKIGGKMGSDDEEYYKQLVKQVVKPKKKNSEKKQIFNADTMPNLSQIFSLNDFEYVAKHLLNPLVYAYIQSGSDNEFTLRENRNALGRIFFRPRCLVDVKSNKMNTEFLGVKSDVPFIVGAFSGIELVNEKSSDDSVVELSQKYGAMSIVAKDSTTPLNKFASQSIFYQYSIDTKDELSNAADHLKELKRNYPNIKAFFISVDTPVRGNLEHFKKIEAQAHQYSDIPAPQLQLSTSERNFSLTWDDLIDLKEKASVPIVLKGVQRVEDVILSKKLGFAGALISNHGGKQLDQGLSPIEVLYKSHQEFSKQKIDIKSDKFELFVEGGFHRGSDIIKALCLGATPAISKPFLYSQIYGNKGFEKALNLIKSEINRDMKLLGANSINDLTPELLDCESLNFRVVKKDYDDLYGQNYSDLPPPPFKNQQQLKMVKC